MNVIPSFHVEQKTSTNKYFESRVFGMRKDEGTGMSRSVKHLEIDFRTETKKLGKKKKEEICAKGWYLRMRRIQEDFHEDRYQQSSAALTLVGDRQSGSRAFSGMCGYVYLGASSLDRNVGGRCERCVERQVWEATSWMKVRGPAERL